MYANGVRRKTAPENHIFRMPYTSADGHTDVYPSHTHPNRATKDSALKCVKYKNLGRHIVFANR